MLYCHVRYHATQFAIFLLYSFRLTSQFNTYIYKNSSASDSAQTPAGASSVDPLGTSVLANPTILPPP